MKNFILLVIFVITHEVMAMSDITVILNEGKIGDQNQLNGIVEALKSKSPSLSVEYISNTEITSLKEIIKKACSDNDKKNVILTSGHEGIQVINEVENQLCPNVVVVNTAHMIFKDHFSILGKANIIAVPKHSIDDNFLSQAKEKKTEIIQTLGVAHNVSLKIMKEEYKKFAGEFKWLEGKEKIAMVVLGGDAPTPEGKMKFYTAEEAAIQGGSIGKFCKKENYSLIIFNGPRTGQYDPATSSKNESAHKTEKLDLSTEAFIKKVEEYLNPSQFKLYNFSHVSPSPYKAGFWLVKNAKEGVCFLPGESTSMISEGNDNLVGRTIIINNGAMNEVHLKHVESEINAGRAIIFDPALIILPEKSKDKDDFIKDVKPASKVIAGKLLKYLPKK